MSGIVEFYNDVLYNKNDKRTENWFLVSSPIPVFTIIFSYLYFSISLGPKIMRNKKPFTLRNTLIIYNFIQVLLSIYLVHEGLLSGWLHHYSFKCQPVDYSTNPLAMRMARGCYLYFICKLIELLDTVFFVLRKKQRQISFLHIYHHALMPFCGWIGVRYFAGGHGTLLGVINSFIHVLMYMYYMLAAFGPEVQKYLWWKKHLTSLQLLQFTIILYHNLQVLVTDCNYPKVLSLLLCINAIVFIYLFGSFYITNYNKKSNNISDKAVENKFKANGSLSNGNTKTNGHTNGYTNGYSNGHISGHTNGQTYSYTNGHAKVDQKME